MHMSQSLFYLTIALHVSGIIITHLQKHETTVNTASGNRCTVIESVKFLLLKSTCRLEQSPDKINSVTCASCWDFYIRILLRCTDPCILYKCVVIVKKHERNHLDDLITDRRKH
jgi:hypothetical protein